MISEDHEFEITTAPNRDSRHWTRSTVTWGEILEWMQSPAKTKACGNYVLGVFGVTTVRHKEPGGSISDPCTNMHRTKVAVEYRSALTLDVDYPKPNFLEVVKRELGCAALIHTTYSSTPEEPRYRLIIPLSRDVSPDEYHTAAAAIMQLLGEKQFDEGSVQPERYMFRPSEQKKGFFSFLELGGPAADVEELLANFKQDLSDIPAPKAGRSKRDPFGIEGTVGAFNRAYERMEDLIAEYDLPYEDAGTDRWQLVGATAAAGMSLVAPGLVFSHHANDPAYGQTCSAFDLARLHMFGMLDENTNAKTPVNRLPSTLAMQEMATQDMRVMMEVLGDDFSTELEATDEAISQSDWRLGFSVDSKTGVPRDIIHNWDLIANNDPALQGLYYNELSLAIESDRDLPWREVTEDRRTFDAGDRSSLAMHIERAYALRPARAYLDDIVSDKARNRRVNPVRDYLDGLVWDGKPRVETCLPGVRATPFTRLAARKSITAAVARMYEPGVKWDHMLVFYGLEGLGKSYWVEKMSRGYSAPLGKIGDKDTLLIMQRSWIITADEGHSLRKADFDAQKEFLTRTADVFRAPYEREVAVHKRHGVIWGSTNDDVFLRRQEGNRRFLIVKTEDKVDFEALTPEYVDQVWAEALTLYRAGEQLWLTDEEGALAATHREAFTEEDALSGIIQEYVDTKVPDDWEHLSPMDRQMWLMNSGDGMTPLGTNNIDQVCSVQIWTEAMGRRYGDHKRVDLLEINTALKQIPGWTQIPGRHRVPGYGPQSVFQRESTLDGMDLI